MNRFLIAVIGFYIIILQIVDSGLIKNKTHSSLGEEELTGNENWMVKTFNKNGFIRLPIGNGERGEIEIKLKTNISLTSNTKSDRKPEYDCDTKDLNKTRPSTSQPLDTNRKVEVTQIVQKAVENLEIKTLCPSHRLALQITQQITEKTMPASDSILFINNNQNVFFSSENHNQSEFHVKQKTKETEINFQKTPAPNTTPLAPNSTTKNGGSKSNLKDERVDTILESDSITCLHSTKKGLGNLENVTMTCNDTNCVLKASSQKSTSWLCGSFICNVAKGIDLNNHDGKDNLVMDCSAEDRSLIAAPLKCLPDEKLANNKCRKIYKV